MYGISKSLELRSLSLGFPESLFAVAESDTYMPAVKHKCFRLACMYQTFAYPVHYNINSKSLKDTI